MNLFDLLVVLMVIAAAVGGYRLGFLTRAISWLGLAAGVGLAIAIIPALTRRVDDGSDSTLLILAVATLMGCALIGLSIGLATGSHLQIALPHGSARQIDQVAGAALGVVVPVFIVWLLLPTMSSLPGVTSQQVRSSVIAEELHAALPDAPRWFDGLRRLVGDSVPNVLGEMSRAPDPGLPPAAPGMSQAVSDRVAASTVKVQGVACRRIQEGSGWVVDRDLIVTNAHVVAGEPETRVQLPDGSERDAVVVAYDARRDLALLRVDGLGLDPLPMRDAGLGDEGGVFGHPGGGPLTVSPFRVGDQINAVGTDIYDRQRSERRVLVLASALEPGDSGAAVVDSQGNVIGVAFAIAPDREGVAYALELSELRAVMQAHDLSVPESTDTCLV